ncbi:MAG: response regulator, partial [Cyclobacteriaceae bacterium]
MNSLLNVLVVEDELLISEMLREMLNELGHHVVASARSYTEALAHLKQHPTINLALLDINLGTGKNGMDVAQEIKTQYPIPFIFLT